MWDTIIGGAIALAGVALAQWWQSRRTREEAAERRAADKAQRLRAAYYEIVGAAEWLRTRALELMERRDEMKWDKSEWRGFVEKLTEEDMSISDARVSLLLEADDADRRDVLSALLSARSAHATFKLALVDRWDDESEDRRRGLFDALSELESAVDEVAKLARARLVELEGRDERVTDR